jgi:DNA modification methylase
MMPVADLVPYAGNSKDHPEEQVQRIVASIREFGFINPVLVNGRGGIIAGHGRVLAAQALGLAEVPCRRVVHLTEEQERAYRIADNKLTESPWLMDALKSEMEGLLAVDFDLNLLGFNEQEVAAILAPAGNPGLSDPDDAPPVPEEPETVPGDLYILGRHRVLCGDSTVADDVALLLGDVRPGLMVTDPPYGVNYDPKWRDEWGLGSGGMARGKVKNDDRADWRDAWALFPGAVAYVWHAGLHSHVVTDSLLASAFQIRSQIVWVKTKYPISRGHYHWQHEPCLYGVRDGQDDNWRFIPEHEVAAYAVKKGGTANWHGGRKQSTVWFIEHLKCDTGHGTQKPVECMKRPIENNSDPGQSVYDPFLGSGTTLIAAEMCGRTCFGMELDPAYVDVIVKRWETFTGEKAVRHGRG